MTKTIETLNQEERYLFDAVEQIWPAFDDNEHLSGLEWESIGVNFDGHTSFGGEIKHFYADCFTRAEIHLAHKNECKYVWSVNTLFEKGYSLGQYYTAIRG